MRLSGYGNVPGAPGGKEIADVFRTMEFQYGRDGQPGLAGLQPITPSGYIPEGTPMPMGNPYNMYPQQQQVAFNISDLNPFKNVMGTEKDNSVEFGGKMIDKNLYEQLRNSPERMQEYIRQQHLNEGGQKYF
tara:strand:- start:144 stop:539 length:396 start_codon:yes stop_codon:yes gene_type:complete